MKTLLEYIDVVAEETSPINIILAVAELMRKEADASRETAKTSIFVFLDKLNNAGLPIDYPSLKGYYDADPRLSNVIQQFNDREIEFVGQGDEDEAPDTGAPTGEVPPEKKVNQMAKAALAKRESIGEDVEQADMFPDAPKTKPKGYFDSPDHEYKDWKWTKDVNQKEAEVEKKFPIGTKVEVNGNAVKFQKSTPAQLKNFEGKKLLGTVTAHAQQGRSIDDRWLIVKLDEPVRLRRRAPVEKVYVSQYQAKLIIDNVKEDEYAALDSFTNNLNLSPEEDAKIAAGPDTYEADEKLMAKLMDHFSDEMPYGTQKGRDGDPYEFIFQELDNMGLIKEGLDERKLDKAEKSKMKHYEKKIDKKDFIERYGKDRGEMVYYATITKMAKEHA